MRPTKKTSTTYPKIKSICKNNAHNMHLSIARSHKQKLPTGRAKCMIVIHSSNAASIDLVSR